MTTLRYAASGPEAEFQPGSRGRVLRNLLGIIRVRDMEEAESQALEIAQDTALGRYGPEHRFSARDVCELHRLWLGPVYPWAGEYRAVNIGKGGFHFAHAPLIPRLMRELERGPLRRHTPCIHTDEAAVAHALADVHGELILVHPFRDGNGRLARLMALLMALQAGLPPLDFTPIAGRGKRAYIAAIHAAMATNYAPLTRLFLNIIDRSQRLAASSRQRTPSRL
jgi:cell filamentation protein